MEELTASNMATEFPRRRGGLLLTAQHIPMNKGRGCIAHGAMSALPEDLLCSRRGDEPCGP